MPKHVFDPLEASGSIALKDTRSMLGANKMGPQGGYMMQCQRSLRAPAHFDGIGLHTGVAARVSIYPAPIDHGITFCRTDLPSTLEIAAVASAVQSTDLATTLCKQGSSVTIATVEHLLGALYGLGIDNALVHVHGPEIPILDGSAAPFAQGLTQAGIEDLRAPKHLISVKKEIRVQTGNNRLARIKPHTGLRITCTIDFDHPLISTEPLTLSLCPETFARDIAPARTFGFRKDIGLMRQRGLALGGSLNNAIIIDGYQILNPKGLRFADEWVRHKILDALGDLALLGYPINGHVILHCTGHALNVALVQQILSDPSNYELTTSTGAKTVRSSGTRLEPVELTA